MNQEGMRATGRSGSPLLIECDRQGTVVWMSQGAERRLGAVKLVGELAAGGAGDTLEVRFTRVLEWGDRVLINADVRAGGTPPDALALVGLLRLQTSMVGHYLRLHNAQMRLAEQAGRRPKRGRKLIELLDLERQRLGRELHTGVGQALAAIRLQLEIVTQGLVAPPAPVLAALDRIASLAGEALDQVRGVSHRLHPPDWQALPLAEALRRQWESSGLPERFQAALELEPLERDLPLPVKVLLYRAAQEAEANIIRHSGAARVTARLHISADRVILTVEDDGHGFTEPSSPSGIGLRSIREQAAELGGEFQIRSGPGGTTFTVSLPIQQPEAE